MLFQLGPITISSPVGLNATGTTEEFGSDYAVKAVVGAQQPREFVGQADTKFTITGTLFPHFMVRHGKPNGLGEIALLREMAADGSPQMLIRGDGFVLGWFYIEHVKNNTNNMHRGGIGRQIEYTIELVSSPVGADPGSIFDTLDQLFSGGLFDGPANDPTVSPSQPG